MQITASKTFLKDLNKIIESAVLQKLRRYIGQIEKAESIHNLQGIKKLKGYNSYFRIKIRDYRLGIEIDGGNVTLLRFLERKDIYKYFPKK